MKNTAASGTFPGEEQPNLLSVYPWMCSAEPLQVLTVSLQEVVCKQSVGWNVSFEFNY